MKFDTFLDQLVAKFLSAKSKELVEKIILIIAIVSFLVHLLLIYLIQYEVIRPAWDMDLFKGAIAAIYTPFSFILIYEVYLLIFYIPKSITTYVCKQYEIITLIVIRRLFKDLSHLEFTPSWVYNTSDRQFSYDIILSILVFFIIYLFRINIYTKTKAEQDQNPRKYQFDSFVRFKKMIAVGLVPILAFIASYSLLNWLGAFSWNKHIEQLSFRNINNVFYEDFFTILIIVDVLMLLISFFYTGSFHKVIRNSGFIISTILIRLSFSTEGLLNNLLILSALLFGLSILLIHNKFEKLEIEDELYSWSLLTPSSDHE